MGKNKELYPKWLNIERQDFIGGYRGMLERGKIAENLFMLKEKFPDGWVFTVAPDGEAETGILCMKGHIAVDNHNSIGALYNEKSGELVRAKFSFRTLMDRYDSYIDSSLTKNDLDLVNRLFEDNLDLNCEVELGPNPVLNISMVDYTTGSLIDGKMLANFNLDPTIYGDLGGDSASFEFLGRFSSIQKVAYFRIFNDKVAIGIVEEKGLEYREMFHVKRRTNKLNEFGKNLSSDRRWFPILEELNETLESVSPSFGFKYGLG